MDFADKAIPARKGEELSTRKLETFLKDSIPGLSGDLNILQFTAGGSNLTYLLTMGDRELVLRRPPFGSNVKTAHDMNREHRILRALQPVFSYCPKPLLYCDDPGIMDCPFHVMERVHGIILRRDIPRGMSFTVEQARQLCLNFIETMMKLHAVDYQAIGLEGFGNPDGYIKRQVLGWTKRYRAARTEDVPDGERVMDWLAENMPNDTDRPTIVHNDFRLDNMVLDEHDPTRIVGVLDWEMATIGDPVVDLGNAMASWMQGDDSPDLQALSVMPKAIERSITRKEILTSYFEKTGRTDEDFHFYYCFGLFRLAAIAQQIYYRYCRGFTRDERFKNINIGVQVLEKTACDVIKQSM